jgi:phosphohistidine phosphatase
VSTGTTPATRKLLVLRHAHAESGSGDDRARHLDARGRRQATYAGTQAVANVPELALVSDAVRTRETFECFCDGLGQTVEAQYLGELYYSDVGVMTQVLATSAPAELSTVLVVGHNPAVTALCWQLIGEADRQGKGSSLGDEGMRPGMLATLVWTGDWDTATAQDVSLEGLAWLGSGRS